MAKFSDILGELAIPLGKGLERGLMGEEELAREERAFYQQAPMRRRKREEEEEFTIRGEERKSKQLAAQQEALAGELGALAQSLGLPVPTGPATITPGPAAMADILREPTVTPGRPRLAKEGIPLLTGMLRTQQRTQRAPTMTELFLASAAEKEAGARGPATKALEAGAGFAGAQTGARQQATPLPPAIQSKLGLTRDLLRQIRQAGGVIQTFRPEFYGPLAGPTGDIRQGRLNQLLGGALMGNPERMHRSAVQHVTDTIARLSEGAVIPEPMMRRLERFIPSTNLTPEQVLPAWERFEQELKNFQADVERIAVAPKAAVRGGALGGPFGSGNTLNIGGHMFIEEPSEE